MGASSVPAESRLSITKEGANMRLAGSAIAVIAVLLVFDAAFSRFEATKTSNAFLAHLEERDERASRDRASFLAHLQERERQVSATLERIETKQDKVAELRITQCHNIQEQAIDTMAGVREVLVGLVEAQRSQADLGARWSLTLENIKRELKLVGVILDRLVRASEPPK